GLRLRVLLLDDRLAHLEADALELADNLLDVRVAKVILDRERLELGGLDPAPLLPPPDQRAGALRLKQFLQLALGQRVLYVLSFLAAARLTFPRQGIAPVRTCGDGGSFLVPAPLIMDARDRQMLNEPVTRLLRALFSRTLGRRAPLAARLEEL